MHTNPFKLARKLTKLTNEKLAERMGLSAGYVSRMSNNSRPVTTAHIEKLAAIVGKSVEEYYQLLGTTPGEVEEAAEALTGHPYDEPLMLDPTIFEKAYERARAIEQTMLGGRGSNADFAIIFERVYADIAENGEN